MALVGMPDIWEPADQVGQIARDEDIPNYKEFPDCKLYRFQKISLADTPLRRRSVAPFKSLDPRTGLQSTYHPLPSSWSSHCIRSEQSAKTLGDCK